MSLYNDPRNFQTYRADLSSSVKNVSDGIDQPVHDVSELETPFAFLMNPKNYKYLTYLTADQNVNDIGENTKLSVKKVIDGFVGFGFEDEGKMVYELLKGIGQYDERMQGYVFSPKDIQEYYKKVKQEPDNFADYYQDMLIKAVCEDGKQFITKESLSRAATEHKVYLSEQEVETIMAIVAKQASGQKVMRLTPEMLKEAIMVARANSGKSLQSLGSLQNKN